VTFVLNMANEALIDLGRVNIRPGIHRHRLNTGFGGLLTANQLAKGFPDLVNDQCRAVIPVPFVLRVPLFEIEES